MKTTSETLKYIYSVQRDLVEEMKVTRETKELLILKGKVVMLQQITEAILE